MIAVLAIDLFLSATIFLLLPAVLWEVPAFYEAAFFNGPRPWLGILFWSTFSTSVVFYFFVLSAFLLRVTYPLVKLVRIPINVEAEPVVGVFATMGIVVTLISVVGWAISTAG